MLLRNHCNISLAKDWYRWGWWRQLYSAPFSMWKIPSVCYWRFLKKILPHQSLYSQHNFQNELLYNRSNNLLRKKLYDVRESNFLRDEYTDISNKEQLSFCVRWIDENMNSHEDFLGCFEIPDVKTNTIVYVIKEILIRMQLPIDDLRR